LHRLLQRQLKKLGIEDVPSLAQWMSFIERVNRAYVEADQDRYTTERALELSSAEMRTRYAELRDTQRALVEASRKAGMADVATSVLHNIGNVLNSANVSARLLSEQVKKSPRGGLSKALALLSAQPKPGAFLDEDERGKKLLPYLSLLDEKLTEEHVALSEELSALGRHIEHLKAVVNDQLAAARNRHQKLVLEHVPLDELVRDAVELSEVKNRPGVTLVYELESFSIEIDRHKFTQVLVNLVRNASDSLLSAARPGVITLRTFRTQDGRALISVEDTGVGVSEEHKGLIFNHGFTTKETGNGYGLHHSACVAIELGGTLSCLSRGVGMGATFTLELPLRQPTRRSRSPISSPNPRVELSV
jgi:two-component system, LuxR family, sensor kinase FixL